MTGCGCTLDETACESHSEERRPKWRLNEKHTDRGLSLVNAKITEKFTVDAVRLPLMSEREIGNKPV